MNGGGGYKSAEEADQASMDVEDTEWSGAESNQWKDSQPETWKVLYFLFVIILIEFSINIRTTKLFLTTSKTNFINRIFKKFVVPCNTAAMSHIKLPFMKN